jgi:hypothetical protein
METIHKNANKYYIGTDVYISYKRKRFIVMDLKSKEKWANEYHKTIEDAISFCEINGFKINPSPEGEQCEWPKRKLVTVMKAYTIEELFDIDADDCDEQVFKVEDVEAHLLAIANVVKENKDDLNNIPIDAFIKLILNKKNSHENVL